ncbi:MAG: AprI/Inh family metalloprotease inhibitor [Rhodobiaceae bacterium]|nr:AprI/Inh family metalloprotease inhibitor [Rhodobiaceae bacterium]MCC0048167.1 AprI/Inh family metalloprotease inhibitor [Rhodobiaceae bacterium]
MPVTIPFRPAAATALAFLALVLMASGASAQRFTLAGADGIVVCGLALEPPAPGAQPLTGADGNPLPPAGKVTPDAECAAKFTTLPQMTQWVGGEDGVPLQFLGSEGQLMIEFQDIGDGIRVGRFPAGGIAYLAVDAAAAGSADSAQAEDAGGSGIAGSWAFARGADGSDQLCEVNMSDETGSSGLPALAPQAGCSDAITVLDLAGWKLDGGRLSVHDSSGKERLSFSQQDGPVWIRDPAGSRPLFLIRTGE